MTDLRDLKELSRYDKIVLPNGTRILVRQETNAPYVTLRARVGYGHCHDPVEIDGLAHFAEHMFFKSNHRYSGPEIPRLLFQLTGTEPNAFTGQDEMFTEIYLMPSKSLEQVADIIASGIYNPQVNREEFEREREAVLNELRSVGEFERYRRGVIMRDLHPNNPYGFRFGDNIDSISSIQPEQLDHIRTTYFGGQNLTVVLAGDVQGYQVKKVEELFGVGTSERVPELPEVKPLDKDITHSERFGSIPPIDKPMITVTRIVQVKPGKEGIALDILGGYLGGGLTSILYDRLKEQLGIVYSAGADLSYHPKKSYFITVAVGFQESNIESITRIMDEELERVKQGEIKVDTLELAKDSKITNRPRRIERVRDRAEWILEREVKGLFLDHQEYVDTVQSITPQDLTDVAQKYLGVHKLTFIPLHKTNNQSN